DQAEEAHGGTGEADEAAKAGVDHAKVGEQQGEHAESRGEATGPPGPDHRPKLSRGQMADHTGSQRCIPSQKRSSPCASSKVITRPPCSRASRSARLRSRVVTTPHPMGVERLVVTHHALSASTHSRLSQSGTY